ncbi:MAG: biotin transporter BioY [Actinomycetota bacterium]
MEISGSSAALHGGSGVLADRARTGRLTAVLLTLGGTAVVGLFAQVSIPLPFTPVPLTGQTLGVLLIGAALGPRRSAISLAIYLLAGAVGLPLYAGGASGWAAVTGPTGGYLVGFIAAAGVVGAMAARGFDRRPGTTLAAYATGSVIIYLFGATWLAVALGIGAAEAFGLGVAPFLLGDAMKALIAAGLLPSAWRVVRRSEERDA